MTPALAALTNPRAVPAAAATRLAQTAAGFRAAGAQAGEYRALMVASGQRVDVSARLLRSVLAGTATEQEVVGLLNAERVSAACARLFEALAAGSVGRRRFAAMQWGRLARHWYADTALVRKEHAPMAVAGVDLSAAGRTAPIRVLPGAEPALSALGSDALLATWDPPELAEALARWVVCA